MFSHMLSVEDVKAGNLDAFESRRDELHESSKRYLLLFPERLGWNSRCQSPSAAPQTPPNRMLCREKTVRSCPPPQRALITGSTLSPDSHQTPSTVGRRKKQHRSMESNAKMKESREINVIIKENLRRYTHTLICCLSLFICIFLCL